MIKIRGIKYWYAPALLLLVWTSAILVSLSSFIHKENQNILNLAQIDAQASLDKDLLYRSWSAGHGGLYAPITDASPPNPYLADIPERDITTPSGRRLTLINPAYMTRQIHELEKIKFGLREHITSLNPLRPQNAADQWEAAALHAFEQGKPEISSVENLDGESYLRLMKPLLVERPCLKCHEKQGYKEGDIRGGISVSVPMKPYFAIGAAAIKSYKTHYGIAWLLGTLIVLAVSIVMDRSRKKNDEATEALARSEANLRQAQDIAMLGHYVLNISTGNWTCSSALDHIFGMEATSTKTVKSWLDIIHPEDREEMSAYLRDHVLSKKLPFDKEYRIIRKSDRAVRWVHGKGDLNISKDGVPQSMFGIIQDITFNKEAQEKTWNLQNQLQQSQKMEAVGRLAGGIAHDFNNILTGISGYTEMLLSDLREENPMHADLNEIKKATDRAASLTAQLLAFSRKQIISPRVLNLNALLDGSTKMLQRLIGEDVDMVFSPAGNLANVRVDPHQIEQILINLVVNARDAMPEGGKLTIETGNATINESHINNNDEIKPGTYALLAVMDTGCGMSPEIQEHLFEPFFTTKDRHKGTGLGLSMIYGIVQQNNGFIQVHSEVGVGTTFKIYLPTVDEEVEPEQKPKTVVLPKGTETILLIEDENLVRALAQRVLEKQGYRVLAVDHGSKAFALAEDGSIRIDLLLTDVILPDINGRKIYERIAALRPGLRVLYMSGHTEHAITDNGILESGTNFIQKPFSVADLARRVREIFDEKV